MTDDLFDVLPISGVTEVTRVQTRDDGDSDVTPSVVPGVAEVTTVADLLANAMEPDEAEAQHDPITVVPESDRPCFRVYDGWT
jgi:putative DNA primase/helicase